MIIKPKIRGFVCITAHPEGCEAHIREQIAHVRRGGPIADGPKNVLVIGSSTGYGLSSRIVSAFGCGAKTLGVFFERASDKGRPATAGWYNSAAFEKLARAEGLWARSVNGDAFSSAAKEAVLKLVSEEMGPIDLIVYSLASPRRTDPVSGETYRSVLKPIGQPFTAQNLNTDKKLLEAITIEPASAEEIEGTVKVMGGEDWELWVRALDEASLLAEGCMTVAYDYEGPEVTWPVYKNGTIGQAKKHLKETGARLDDFLKLHRGAAFLSVNKAVVTQASSAIPVVPLYISLLFRIMKEKGLHEGCIEQIDRLFRTQMYAGSYLHFDEAGKVRLDDWEMRPEIQAEVARLWPEVSNDNIDSLTDFAGYQKDFLKLFGFALDGVNYEAETEPVVDIEGIVNLA